MAVFGVGSGTAAAAAQQQRLIAFSSASSSAAAAAAAAARRRHHQRAGRSSVACRAVAALPTVTVQAAGTAEGVQVAPLVNGCWQLAGGHGRSVYDSIQAKLAAAADAGFTTLDTADIYGPSEQIIGEFVASRPPNSVQALTKFVPNIFRERVTPAGVAAAVDKSRAALRVDKLDLVALHWWDYGIKGMVDAGKALADLQAAGKVKQIGVTNMDCAAVRQLLDAGVPVASNQVQFSLLDRRPITGGMLELAQERGFKLFTYGSVGGGLLSDRYVEAPKTGLFGQQRFTPVDLNTSSLKMYWGVTQRCGGQPYWRELLAALAGVAAKHEASVAAVALAWVLTQADPGVVVPIVGFRSTDHLESNRQALRLALDAEDEAAIDAVLAAAKWPAGAEDIYSFERSG